MSWQEWVWVGQIFGWVAAGLSAFVASATYLRSQLQRQADDVRTLLFQCQLEFETVSKHFDKEGVLRVVREIVSHEQMGLVLEDIWHHRADPKETIEEILEAHSFDLSFAINTAIALADEGRANRYDEGFRAAMIRLNVRYPVLHKFLFTMHHIMISFLDYMRWSERYNSMIRRGILAMHTHGDLQKASSSCSVSSFLYGWIFLNFSTGFEEDRLDEFFAACSELLEIFLHPYKESSDFRLWQTSRTERHVKWKQYITPNDFPSACKLLIDIKRSDLKQSYGNASNLVGNLQTLLSTRTTQRQDVKG